MAEEDAEAKAAGESLLTVAEASKPVPVDEVTMPSSGKSGREVARGALLTLTTSTPPSDEAYARTTFFTTISVCGPGDGLWDRRRIPADPPADVHHSEPKCDRRIVGLRGMG